MNGPNNRLHLPGHLAGNQQMLEQQMAMMQAQQNQLVTMHISITSAIVANGFDRVFNDQDMEELATKASKQATILLKQYGIEIKFKEQEQDKE